MEMISLVNYYLIFLYLILINCIYSIVWCICTSSSCVLVPCIMYPQYAGAAAVRTDDSTHPGFQVRLTACGKLRRMPYSAMAGQAHATYDDDGDDDDDR
jgi:hypothetical protein